MNEWLNLPQKKSKPTQPSCARKAAMYRSPASRARKAKRERQQARRDAEEAERCRLRMLAVLNLPGGRP